MIRVPSPASPPHQADADDVVSLLLSRRYLRRNCQAPADRASGHHARKTRERGDADRDRTDDGKHQLPGFRRHGVLHDAVRGVVAGEGGGRDKGERDQQPSLEWANNPEQELAEAERQPGRDHADQDRARPARARVIRPTAGGEAREEGQREDGEREQKPSEEADGRDGKDDAEKDHGGVSERTILTVAPSTTTARRGS
ncbi:hypothetical protein NI456_03390 [Brevundimonas diminuta]|uniref:hypothetical protein n=1 Tax=Brevundimonas diminuta TaxID=293 RepID=UPI002097373D|nr:hypothetical protein [Brevundimonas diminuta]MCO8017896.1 hypothetical protein [Brevundimonas diminuta]MCO8021416.1 hypothetical protein [Brevundimonas diminuta]